MIKFSFDKIKLFPGLSAREKTVFDTAALVFFAALVYYNSLFNLFNYDDITVIEDNSFLTDFKNLPQFFSKAYFLRSQEATYRPLVTLSYMFDYFLFKFRPAGYHLVNLFWHLGNVSVLYCLVNLIIRKRQTAFLTALFFALHPINTEAVNCIGFREDLICAFFYLLAFVCYIKRRIILSASLFMLSLFAKEMGITLPLFIGAYYMLFERPACSRPVPEKKIGGSKKWFCCVFSRYLYVCIIFVVIRFFVMVSPIKNDLRYLGNTFYEVILTSAKIFTDYIMLLIAPVTLSLRRAVVIRDSFFDKDVLLAFGLLIPVFGAGLYNLSKNRIISFAVFWFFAGLVPVSNFVPLYNPMAERYLYLPAIGYYILLALLLSTIMEQDNKFLKKIGIVCAVFIITCYSLITFLRNFDWKSPQTLWSKEIKINPDEWGGHNEMGIIYLQKRQYDRAAKEFMTAIKLGADVNGYHNMGLLYYQKGENDKAAKWWQKSLLLYPEYAKSLMGLGVVYLQEKMTGKAIYVFKLITARNPYYFKAYYMLAYAYYAEKDYDKAIKYLKTTLDLYPPFFEGLFDLGCIYGELQKDAEAIAYFKKALMVAPRNATAKYAVGRIYLRKGEPEKAVVYFKDILSLNPDVVDAHYYLGIAYEKLKLNKQAEEEFRLVKKLKPGYSPPDDSFGKIDIENAGFLLDSEKS